MILSHTLLLCFGALLGSLNAFVSALGTTCSTPTTIGTSSASEPFWMESITHRGTSAFNSDPSSYQVFRNVKDFGAVGDGVTDDTAAINAAISSGGRCGPGCPSGSSSTTPAIVYFPQGTYLISTPIQTYYWTQLIGDAKVPPTLLASAEFNGIAVIDADPYEAGGAQWFINQDNFYRSVRNFVIDLTQMPASATATGLHWQVSQATSLMNIVVNMSTESGNSHRGMFMENGSGGFMGDLVFNGGQFGIWVGNQQFTVRNITVNNADTAIYALWNWGWTFQGITINDCQIGIDIGTGLAAWNVEQGVGAEAIIDAVVYNTPIFVRSSEPSNGVLDGSLVLNNIHLNNVPTAVGVVGGDVVLNGGTLTIDSWAQGNVYSGDSSSSKFIQSSISSIPKASSLLDSTGRIFGKMHPQYSTYSTEEIVSVKALGAAGDGSTDDTEAITSILEQYAGCKIIFFDAGTYIVSSTITIPAGTQIVGEAWSTIMGSGSAFEDYNNPQVVVRVGEPESQGVVEITDMIFTARGPAAGAIIVEWNVHDPEGQQGAAGAWDTHIILGGRDGSDLQASNCPTSGSGGNSCFAAFLGLHLTTQSSAYLEGLWVWLADHDLDQGSQLSLWSGRGILSESQGPVWMIGTASEHSIMYQYSLVNAQDHYMGLIQTETPYFQPNPVPPSPFIPNSDYHDPSSWDGAAWALTVTNSQDILVFGAGLYSFYSNYGQACLTSLSCQSQIVSIDSESSIGIYSLSTIATTWQLTVDGETIANSADNQNGYAQTVTVWTST